jgi:hypothetical protein
MTLILRRMDKPKWWNLRKCGLCRISLCEIVGCFRSDTNKVIWLEYNQ